MSTSLRNKNRSLRRLKSQLRYYRSTLEEMLGDLGEYESEWIRDRAAALSLFSSAGDRDSQEPEPIDKKSNFSLNERIVDQTARPDEPGESVDTPAKLPEPPKWAKDLFRKIARRTHPDVVKDDCMIESFRKATEAMESLDFDALVDLAIDIGINPGIDSGELVRRLKSRIENAKLQIKKIEESPAWIWGESYGINNIRSSLLELSLRSEGIHADREKLEEFIEKLLDQE